MSLGQRRSKVVYWEIHRKAGAKGTVDRKSRVKETVHRKARVKETVN